VPRRWRKLQHALTRDEVDALRRVLEDPGSGLRQRDRAIVSTLLYTGMRPSDVVALELGDIDWDRDVIELAQRKTGARLSVPLVAQVGNAIFDYVTGERGESDDPHVFLSDEHPYGALVPGSVNNVVDLALGAAGLRTEPGDRRGTRLFRATMATAMLGNGADRAVAASVLGHASPATTDGYMSASVEGLRAHASLDVSAFPMAEGVLSRA
jgi:integrase